jgi:hypothetical protein
MDSYSVTRDPSSHTAPSPRFMLRLCEVRNRVTNRPSLLELANFPLASLALFDGLRRTPQ